MTTPFVIINPEQFFKMAELRPDVVTVDYVKKILASKYENSKLLSVQLEAGSAKGENYHGDLVKIGLRAEINLLKKDFLWMAKLLKPDPGCYGNLIKAFERENRIYQEVIPKLQENDKTETLPRTIPVIYSDPANKTLVLDHMSNYNFRDAIKKKRGLDLNHCHLVFDWFARWHANCHLMMSRYPGGKTKWREDNIWAEGLYTNPPEGMLEAELAGDESQKEYYITIAEKSREKEDDFFAEKLQRLFEKIQGGPFKLEQIAEKAKVDFLTIVHSDGWFNNMLFRYDANNVPQEALLLDFQTSFIGSPGYDLALFLLSSTTKAFRRQHLIDLLQKYHETLLEIDPGIADVYGFQDLMRDYKESLIVGVTFCVFGFPGILLEEGDPVLDFGGVDLTDSAQVEELKRKEEDRLEVLMETNKNVKTRLREVLGELAEEGIL